MDINNLQDTINQVASIYSGVTNINTLYGKLDILTDTKIICVNRIDKWLESIGLITSISTLYPNKNKHIHLYMINNNNNIINMITQLCQKLEIELTIGQ